MIWVTKNIFISNLKILGEHFREDPKLLNSLIRIQSRIRGISTRKSYRKLQKNKNPIHSYNSSFSKENVNELEINFASQVNDQVILKGQEKLRNGKKKNIYKK